MAIRTKHQITENTWFITFTCYSWISLFETSNSYDLVYKWMNLVDAQYKVKTLAFVIMPNHVHAILYLTDEKIDLNKVMANGKRFMAYAIIERLEEQKNAALLYKLHMACSEKERAKGTKT